MRIKRLTLNNIGSFAGEHSFLFQTDNSQKQIVLIGGRNGAGKTTLFESIRLCLYGYKLDWQKKESARAGMRRLVKRLLKKHKYPPEGMDDAVQTVMSQCEMWTDNVMTA